jgi:LysM repeat protein
VHAPRRAEIARYAAPAAFLLALTIAVLLVRAAIGGGGGGGEGVTALTGRTATSTTTAATTRATTTVPASEAGPTGEEMRFYTIESGDTLETVAAKSGVSVDDLLRLNPGIDPHTLRIGQKVRIG